MTAAERNIDPVTMPRSVASSELSELASIYEADVNLCVITRDPAPVVRDFADALLAQQGPIEVARTLRFEHFDGRDLLPAARVEALPGVEAWRRDVMLLVGLFADLFEAAQIGLRLRRLDRPMCPRFHTDFVAVRLICSYGGPGTQWLPEDAIDRRRLGAGSGGHPDEHSGLITRPDAVHEIPPYAIALLKGERWEGNAGRGAVHRSPRAAGGTAPPRLLLTLDLV